MRTLLLYGSVLCLQSALPVVLSKCFSTACPGVFIQAFSEGFTGNKSMLLLKDLLKQLMV